VLDEAGASVTAAYPFCSWPTEHWVSAAGGRRVSSLCAIDALGAGAMLGEATLVESACRSCGAPIRIATREQGHALASATPEPAVVWYGVHYAGGCSATSGCTLKSFFCTREHLARWRAAEGHGGTGFVLSLEAALEIGRAIFQPLLAP
jgi:mercuric reductase